ncbi:MAG: hypothetical protein Q9190_001736 [Brigantiaea leucoxantha]
MTTADVRDMLGLPTDGQPRPKLPKKPKQEPRGRKPGGLEREIQSLHGDRPPPLPIIPVTKYKERPKRSDRARPWDVRAFGNRARSDGLILHHWVQRKSEGNTAAFPNTPADSNAASEEQDDRIEKPELESVFAKFNIRVDRPTYTEDQYSDKLRSDDWSKEETDYLMNLVFEFDLRWILIADRYDYKPLGAQEDTDSMAIDNAPKNRSMEDLKARYYHVAATVMALTNPLTSMSASEFETHEKMTKFDPEQEKRRKIYAESLLLRSSGEIQEEEMLLAELKRIVRNEEKFAQEREDLYARLDPVQGSSTATAVDRSSQGLNQLMQTLISAERSKRKKLLGMSEGTSSPANGAAGQGYGGHGDRAQRQSVGSAADKRSSLLGASSQRQLSAREEHKYGVTHHERLTAGVQFRHERITKLSQAKSNAQSTKISAALTELNIPPRLNMPTAKVCTEFERLIQSIHILLDVRKVSDKFDTEIKILQAQQEPKESQDDPEGHAKSLEQDETLKTENTEEQERDGSQTVEGKAEGEEEEAEAEEDADADAEAEGETQVEAAAAAEASEERPDISHEADAEDEDADAENADTKEEDDQEEEEEADNDNEDDEDEDKEADAEEEEEEEEDEDEEVEQEINGEHDNDAEEADANKEQNQESEQEQEEEEATSASPHINTTTASSSAGRRNSAAGRKRSASVMSAVSTKSVKRPRK